MRPEAASLFARRLRQAPQTPPSAGTMAQIPGLLQSGRTLAIHMYVLSGEGLHMNEAYATAVVLLVVVLLMNSLSALVAKKLTKK